MYRLNAVFALSKDKRLRYVQNKHIISFFFSQNVVLQIKSATLNAFLIVIIKLALFLQISFSFLNYLNEKFGITIKCDQIKNFISIRSILSTMETYYAMRCENINFQLSSSGNNFALSRLDAAIRRNLTKNSNSTRSVSKSLSKLNVNRKVFTKTVVAQFTLNSFYMVY